MKRSKGSRACDDLAPVIEEVVETKTSRDKDKWLRRRFLKGPISMQVLAKASSLGGKALATYVLVSHRADLTKSDTVTVPGGLCSQFGIDKDSKRRALRELEAVGLVALHNQKGQSTRVQILHSHNRV